MLRPIRQRALALVAGAAALGASAFAPSAARANAYGKLIARHEVAPSAPLATGFAHVRPQASFLLVVTEPTSARLDFRWTLHCASASHRESGGASGEAIVSSGHWVKRVRADWIAHPADCTGTISGSAAGSPVLVRMYTD